MAADMSALADPRGSNDDYPEASQKHLADAQVLDREQRHDGCYYLAGYVVECALKSVLLHQASWDPPTRTHSPRKLNAELDRLRTPNHDIRGLLEELARTATPHTAKYVPSTSAAKNVSRWRPAVRYRTPNVSAADSAAVLAEAKKLFSLTVDQMRRDGVI